MRTLLSLPLLLLLLCSSFIHTKELEDRIDQLEVLEAIPTQLETPPDNSEADFDLDYIVNRPVDDDDDEDELPKCNYDSDHGGEGMMEECIDDSVDRTPYKHYKGYKSWKQRPLLA